MSLPVSVPALRLFMAATMIPILAPQCRTWLRPSPFLLSLPSITISISLPLPQSFSVYLSPSHCSPSYHYAFYTHLPSLFHSCETFYLSFLVYPFFSLIPFVPYLPPCKSLTSSSIASPLLVLRTPFIKHHLITIVKFLLLCNLLIINHQVTFSDSNLFLMPFSFKYYVP